LGTEVKKKNPRTQEFKKSRTRSGEEINAEARRRKDAEKAEQQNQI
jgi:hypothetical protein